MAKFFGAVGYEETSEVRPGVFKPTVTERMYKGEFLNYGIRNGSNDKVNSDISLSNRISILADPYAYENYGFMKYVVVGGKKWYISSIDVQAYPRIILTIGSLYNAG